MMLQIVIFNVFPLWNFSPQIPGGAKAPLVRGQGLLLGQYPPPCIRPWWGQRLAGMSPQMLIFLRPPFTTHIKKVCFFSSRTTKVLSSLHQWLSGPCHFFLFFFFSLIIPETDFDNFFFLPIFFDNIFSNQ